MIAELNNTTFPSDHHIPNPFNTFSTHSRIPLMWKLIFWKSCYVGSWGKYFQVQKFWHW